ncbi:MAG: metallophosphoesterase [Oscillospiraceae bacterium]|nr:metallophosphoesterase [Oscillospiraceae bacterium]
MIKKKAAGDTPSPTTRRKRRIRIISIATALMGCAFTVLSLASFPLRITEYTVYSPDVTREYRIVQVSDLHNSRYGEDMKTLTDAVAKAQPDIVVLTGDMLDNAILSDEDTIEENTYTFCRAMSAYPCFSVAGNHEFRRPEKYYPFREEMEGYGIVFLENRSVVYDELCITGFSQCEGSEQIDAYFLPCVANFDEAPLRDNGRCNVLISHYPGFIDLYRSFGVFDLVLCGHTHGGQWRIPGKKEGLFGPGATFFPEYSGGDYYFGDCTMLVSKGLSRDRSAIPRIFNNPELVVIHILPES